jgi:hypothetical protein
LEAEVRERDDATYYKQRADQERRVAARAEDPAAAFVHAKLAEEYQRRASAYDKNCVMAKD